MNLRPLPQSSLKALCCSIIMLITVDARAAFIIQTTGPTEGGISVTIAAEGYAYFGCKGSNTTIVEPSAILEIESSTQGILIPRISSTERLAISLPVDGLFVYDSDRNYDLFR